ncbi:MAG TPA: hypothetical protein DEH78_13295 [Solibacterales bacterium]|nr:hypothetical protein [Bryobacterales bacterium]
MLSLGRKFLSHVVPAVVRPLRVIWNQIIGFFFAVFAVLLSFNCYRSFRALDGQGESVARVILTGVFGAVMAAYAIHSFLRARKISRS